MNRSPGERFAIIALALAVAVVVIQARVIAGGRTWDDVRYHTEVAPPRLAAAQQIQHGHLPQWWDGAGLGVPLLAEPSHGAAYPLLWLASSPRALDLALVVHVFWLALGVALWARRRTSELGALVAGMLVATTGIVAAATIRGALPALAHVPWVGWAATGLALAAKPRVPASGELAVDDSSRSTRARYTVALAASLAAIALAGELAVLVDAVALACVVGARRATWRWLAVGVGAALAIGSVQWLPAFALHGTRAEVTGLPLARLVELVVPVRSTTGWAPSLFIGAPLLALAAVGARSLGRGVGALALVLAVLALVVGHGGWPAWLGAPELHVAVLAILVAVAAAGGLDAFVAGERAARVAIAAGAAITVVTLLAVLAARGSEHAGALVDAGLGAACLGGALVAVGRVRPLALALLVVPGGGALHSTAPTLQRDALAEPAWAERALANADATAPHRLYRPAKLASSADDEVEDALATLAGTSSARYGIALANTADPARGPVEDSVWVAASHGGDVLLDRFGIALAVLPTSVAAAPSKRPSVNNADELGRRGAWTLVRAPAAPIASVIGNWVWIADTRAALAQLFPAPGMRGAGRGRVVLAGTGTPNEEGDVMPKPCTIVRWDPGAIDLTCATSEDAYAVISSSARDGWSATVDGNATPWVTADVMRRAVALPAGAHAVAWRYAAPGLDIGLVLALVGAAALAALGWLATRSWIRSWIRSKFRSSRPNV